MDLGTGAGLPGIPLAILNYEKINVVDSNGKKIKFVKSVCKKLNLNVNVFLSRIEQLKKIQYDFLISRALSKLNKLFCYSYGFIK